MKRKEKEQSMHPGYPNFSHAARFSGRPTGKPTPTTRQSANPGMVVPRGHHGTRVLKARNPLALPPPAKNSHSSHPQLTRVFRRPPASMVHNRKETKEKNKRKRLETKM